jgi:hypothetical protein
LPQVTVRLDPSVKARFEGYAAEVGLDSSGLARLLFAREKVLQRLFALKNNGSLPRQHRRRAGTGSRLPTITAHFSSLNKVADFDAYATRCGLNRNSAAAWILEKELEERWLERAFRLDNVSRSDPFG